MGVIFLICFPKEPKATENDESGIDEEGLM